MDKTIENIIKEKDFSNSPEFINTILENIPSCIYVKKAPNLEYSYINQTYEMVTGFSKMDIIGKSDYFLFPRDVADQIKKFDRLVLENSKPFEIVEDYIFTKDKRKLLFYSRKIPIYNKAGEIIFVLGISDDVTELYRTQKELKQVEQRFSKIFHSSPMAITVHNISDFRIIDANKKFIEITGYEKDELLLNQNTYESIFVNLSLIFDLLKNIKKDGNILNKEVLLKTKNDDIITMLFSLEQVSFEEVSMVICMWLDISDRKSADNEIIKALERQKELNVLKSQFVSMISHEFRTPLTTIMLSTDLLKRYGNAWSHEERIKHFNRIQDTILRMTQLMENVLIIGRIDSDKFALNPEKINLKEFSETLTESIRFNDNNQHSIDFIFHGLEDEIIAEETLLGLIINNLLTNALKYSPKGSSVIFTITIENGKIILSVQDSGIGIPENDLNHLFQSFYRASNVESIGGYGLGLSIVHKCVNTYNGEIVVRSKEGEGTTFTVTLPEL